jgi:hypothetical protein
VWRDERQREKGREREGSGFFFVLRSPEHFLHSTAIGSRATYALSHVQLPPVVNEPVKTYTKGTPEHNALLEVKKKMTQGETVSPIIHCSFHSFHRLN